MTQDQAIINALVSQRNEAMNALAQAQAQAAVMGEQFEAAKAKVAEFEARLSAIENQRPAEPPPVLEG